MPNSRFLVSSRCARAVAGATLVALLAAGSAHAQFLPGEGSGDPLTERHGFDNPNFVMLEPAAEEDLLELDAAAQLDIRRLEKQTPARSGNYRNHYELGNLFYDAGLLDRAEARYLRAAQINPKFKEPVVNLGSLYQDRGQLDKAVEYFQAALRIDPEDCKARSNLGNAYYAQERYPDAMYEYERALDMDGDCYPALFNMAVAFADVRIYREAIRYWEQVIAVAPGTQAARQAQENVTLLETLMSEDGR